MDEIINEFLIESLEGLDQVDEEFLHLENDPQNQELLQSIFRTVHSLKGACGFLEFKTLESVAHAGENVLDALREGAVHLNQGMVSMLLETTDAIRALLGVIERTGSDSEGMDYADLRQRLEETLTAVDPAELEADLPAPAPGPEGGAPSSDPGGEDPTGGTTPSPVAGEEAASTAVPAAPDPEPVAAGPSTSKPAGKANAESGDEPTAGNASIRLRVEQLDALMNLAGELVLARNQVLQHATAADDPTMTATSHRLNLITTELQEGIMKIRMQPINSLWSKLPRVVRGLAHSLSKEVQVVMEGRETEVDKTLLEALKDPLTHLVRNSLDHGIEAPAERVSRGKPREATLSLSAYHESGQVKIVVADDGKGIDPQVIFDRAVERGIVTRAQVQGLSNRDAYELLFAPGFSTAEKVTNVSGRGVGMDVVRRNLERVSGTVEIESELGRGTQVTVSLPLTLAIIPALTIHSGGQRYALPQPSLVEILRTGSDAERAIESVYGNNVYRLRGQLLPLIDLSEALGLAPRESMKDCNIVVVQSGVRRFGLVVDEIGETEEIVVKPLDRGLKAIPVYGGSTILADGGVALILDVAGLAQRGKLLSEEELSGAALSLKPEVERGTPEHEFTHESLIVTVDGSRRLALDLSEVTRLEDIDPDQIETGGNAKFIQYLDGLLRLIDVGAALGGASSLTVGETGLLKTIVMERGGLSYGLVVEEVVDILEVPVDLPRSPGTHPCISSVGVTGDQLTEYIDSTWLIDSLAIGKRPLTCESTPCKEGESAEECQIRVSAIEKESTRRDVLQLCTFTLDSQLYGIDVRDVQEVLRPLPKTPVPLSQEAVEGLINLRGDTVVLVDLRQLIGHPCSDPGRPTASMNVVLLTANGRLSLAVDEVGEVLDFPTSSQERCPPSVSQAQRAATLGVFPLEESLLIQLDVEALASMAAKAQSSLAEAEFQPPPAPSVQA